MAEGAQLRQRKADAEEEKQEIKTDEQQASSPNGISDSMNKLFGLVALVLTLGLLFRENIEYYVNEVHAVVPLFKQRARLPADIPKRDAVVQAFKHAWHAYERDAMGSSDECHPVSYKGSNLTKAGGIGYTVTDSIDTMQIMDLKGEYDRARNWVANKLSFERDAEYNAAAVTIRVLGGLLSAYEYSKHDPIFLEKAQELADRLLPVFDTPFGIPNTKVNLKKKQGIDNPNNIAVTNEATGVQLEYKFLSHLTGKGDYREKAHKVMELLSNKPANDHPSIFLAVESGKFMTSQVRVGTRGGAFYEYLLKQPRSNTYKHVRRSLCSVRTTRATSKRSTSHSSRRVSAEILPTSPSFNLKLGGEGMCM